METKLTGSITIDLPEGRRGIQYTVQNTDDKPIKMNGVSRGRKTVKPKEVILFVSTKRGWKGIKIN